MYCKILNRLHSVTLEKYNFQAGCHGFEPLPPIHNRNDYCHFIV